MHTYIHIYIQIYFLFIYLYIYTYIPVHIYLYACCIRFICLVIYVCYVLLFPVWFSFVFSSIIFVYVSYLFPCVSQFVLYLFMPMCFSTVRFPFLLPSTWDVDCVCYVGRMHTCNSYVYTDLNSVNRMPAYPLSASHSGPFQTARHSPHLWRDASLQRLS